MMAILRGLKECAKLEGVRLVFVGKFGHEPNWFALPLPTRISDACRRAFVVAFAQVRRQFDLLFRSGQHSIADAPLLKPVCPRSPSFQQRRAAVPRTNPRGTT
jgi:hypothetical protein